MKQAAPKDTESAVRVLKAGTCSSLSGGSRLRYEIGCTAEFEIQFRIVANSKKGAFNDDWVSLNSILQALAKVPSGKPVTSHVLHSLYRSQNSPGFLFAVLKEEGLVRPAKDKPRCYERMGLKGFLSEAKALMDGAPKGKSPAQKADEKSGQTAPDKKAPSKSSAKKK